MTESHPAPITVLVADDNAIVRAGLVSLLTAHADLVVVAEASDGRQAADLVRRLSPAVTLMDVRMPGGDGVAATGSISDLTRVLMLTYNDAPETVRAALREGAAGYLVHGQFDAERLADMVRAAAAGLSIFSSGLTGSLSEEQERPEPDRSGWGLSRREEEVMNLIAGGASNRDLARDLFLAEKTVKNHVNRIFSKMGVSSRSQATTLWLTGELGTRDSM